MMPKLRFNRKNFESLKALLLTNGQELAVARQSVAQLTAANTELEIKLLEARRRTIPMGNGSEINFLPLGIEQVEMKHNTIEVRSLSGYSTRVQGAACAKIIVSGDVVYYPPAKKKE